MNRACGMIRFTPIGERQSRGRVALCLFVGSLVLLIWCATAAQAAPANQSEASKTQADSLTSAQIAQMSSDQLTHYVFEHHGCNNCHSIEAGGRLGFTDRGKQLGKGFEGCVSLLTQMNVISLVKDVDRTASDKKKAARFEEFGCSTCHQILPGKMGFTKYGVKLKSMHLPCTQTCCAR
jgi:hypothetical protein